MKNKITSVIILLTIIAINLFYRLYPVDFPQFKEEARLRVKQDIYRQIITQINQDYPQAPSYVKAKIFKKEIKKYYKDNSLKIKQQIHTLYEKLKDRFQDKTGQTYLMELDCWHWARYVENIELHGYPGDIIKGGQQIDIFMNYPDGFSIYWERFFYYLCWFLYKIYSFIFPVFLYTFLFYLPLGFVVILLSLLFFFCKRLDRTTNITGIFTCLVVGLAPIFIPRSCAGWFDRDVLSLIFPLIISWLYLEAYQKRNILETVSWVIFSAAFLGLFCATWVGWSFILFIILTYEFVIVANLISESMQYKNSNKKEINRHLSVMAIFLLSSVFWIYLFCGLAPFKTLVEQVKEAVVLNKPLTSQIWPNVFSTVGELKKEDYLGIARSVGGVFLFILGLISMLVVFLRLKKYDNFSQQCAIFLVVWFMVMFFFSSRGVRFTMFLTIPLGIFIGWGCLVAYRFISNLAYRKLAISILLIFYILVVLNMLDKADNVARGAIPLMDDNWYSILTRIRDFTPRSSVINSWWDYGDWFKVVAKRAVIFDGQTQNSPRAFWMARVFLTDSEDEAVAILRMLNNGGMRAYDILECNLKDPFEAVITLGKVLRMSKEQGSELLNNILPKEAAEEVTQLLYMPPKEKAYFIVDYSMIGKITAISFLGNWDFIKLYIATTGKKFSSQQVIDKLVNWGIKEEQAKRLYEEIRIIPPSQLEQWLSERYIFPEIVSQKKSTEEDIVLFNNGFIYNPQRKTLYLYSERDRFYHIPISLFLEEKDSLIEYLYNNSTLGYSAFIQEKNQEHKLILLSQPLARSMFVQLYFREGKGLKHFKPFIFQQDESGLIGVYEVLW
ncbi:MAG: hypothetical protein N2606_05340 [Candidatus Omnitrophica bacterium]|nr:hypothetical protein [Candidatus Omnitrophota bacterium]